MCDEAEQMTWRCPHVRDGKGEIEDGGAWLYAVWHTRGYGMYLCMSGYLGGYA